MEFLFNSYILLIQLLHSLCAIFPYSSCDSIHVITPYDILICDCDHVTFSYTPSCIVSPKRKKKDINNNLAILLSYDKQLVVLSVSLLYCLPLIVFMIVSVKTLDLKEEYMF